jgi:hypothetical protein
MTLRLATNVLHEALVILLTGAICDTIVQVLLLLTD